MMTSLYNLPKRFLPSTVKKRIRSFIQLPKKFKRYILRRPKLIKKLLRQYRGGIQAIVFYPDHPCERPWDYSIIRIARELGLVIKGENKEISHACMLWQDTTYGKSEKYFAEKEQVINGQSLDISKSHVDRQFKRIFGYELAINPKQYQGLCVEKSELNGKHDGRIIKSPVDAICDGKVYQKLIDGRCDEQFVVDYRVPIFKNVIPIVFLKYKPIADRFGLSVKATIANSNDIFSSQEINNISKFCLQMGLDCGELDIVRDQADQKIYIVDVNNTPTIRFKGYTYFQRRRIIAEMAKAFQEAFLS